MSIMTPDFIALKAHARRMSFAALVYSRNDAVEASHMAEDLEKEGYRVLKTGGYYRDEASIYSAEIARRRMYGEEVSR